MKRLFMACIVTVICFSFSGSVFAVAPNNDQKRTLDETFTIELPKADSVKEKAAEKQKTSKKEIVPAKEKAAEKQKTSKKQIVPAKEKAEEKQKTSKKQTTPKKQAVPKEQAQAKKQGPTRIALVLPNSIDDMATSQALYDGANSVKEYYAYLNKKGQKKMPTIEIAVSKGRKNTAEATKAIRNYAKKGFDLIIVHGAQYETILAKIAPTYPNTSFAYGPGSSTKHPNIFAYEPQAQEGAYLLGMLAGFLTKSNIIAIADSAKKDSTPKFNQGFVKGVHATNAKAQVHIAEANSSRNQANMQKAVKKYILMGADIISSSGPQSIQAIKEVAKSSKVLWVGSTGINPVKIAPKTVVAAQIYDFSQVINAMLTLRQKKIHGGKTIPLNLENGYEYIQYNQGIRSDYMKALNKAKEAIKNGSLIVAPREKQSSPKKLTDTKQASKKTADKPTAKKQKAPLKQTLSE